MPRPSLVSITPSVLSWAINESGYTRPEVSHRLKVEISDLQAWESGLSKPTLTEFRLLARILRRQTAVFLLPEPPGADFPHIDLRGAPGKLRSALNPDERKFIRQIARIQSATAWIARESGELTESKLPTGTQSENVEELASVVRESLGISLATQLAWKDSSVAFRAWRTALEGHGVLVFLLPLGSRSARGMSLWDPSAPSVIVNSAWNTEARIFTVFHEIGHIVTRTNSACIGYVGVQSDTQRDVERWCDRFAAALLMPRDTVKDVLENDLSWDRKPIDDLQIPSRFARRMKVSLRASVLRLIELDLADRTLYGQIPDVSDDKSGGGGGGGRTRAEAREDQFGAGVRQAFARAVNEQLMTRADALTFLDIGDEDFASELSG